MKQPNENVELDTLRESISGLAEDVIDLDWHFKWLADTFNHNFEVIDNNFECMSKSCNALRDDVNTHRTCIENLTECLDNLHDSLSLITDLVKYQGSEIRKLKRWATGSFICIILLAIAIILNWVL